MNAQKINGGSLEASKRSTKHGGGGGGERNTPATVLAFNRI